MSEEDISNWWTQGLKKHQPGRKRSKSDSVIEGNSVKKNSDKENDPVSSVLSESFGSHSFVENKEKRKYNRKDNKWGKAMGPKVDKNKDQREMNKIERKNEN